MEMFDADMGITIGIRKIIGNIYGDIQTELAN